MCTLPHEVSQILQHTHGRCKAPCQGTVQQEVVREVPEAVQGPFRRCEDVCSRARTSAGVAHLSALRNLETLSMAYSLAGDPSMAAVAELTQLQHLDLDSCPITNACVLSSLADKAMAISCPWQHQCATFIFHSPLICFMLLPCSCRLRDGAPPDSSDMAVHVRTERLHESSAELLCMCIFHTWTPSECCPHTLDSHSVMLRPCHGATLSKASGRCAGACRAYRC